jgi:hypothetical protein
MSPRTVAAALAALLLVLATPAAAANGNPKDMQHAAAMLSSCTSCKAGGKDYFCTTTGACFDYHWDCSLDCHGPCQPTTSCKACASGSDCSCAQCKAVGYSAYCATAKECYDSEETCGISCAKDRNCVPTATCGAAMTCAADSTLCAAGQTCCVSSNATRFCSPFPKAVCCTFGNMSCPAGHVCDPPTGTCVPPAPATPHCTSCMKIVKHIESVGCADVSKEFSNSTICELIVKLKVCSEIVTLLEAGYTPLEACSSIGICGTGSCPCGYCTPPLYGQACLAAPNTCPASVPSLRLFGQWVADERRSTKRGAAAAEARGGGGEFCVDGHCTAGNVGCCLTCAP